MAKKRNGEGNGVKTLGPISDLERHLPSDWWQKLFNSLYLKTDGDVVENNQNTQNDVDLLVNSTGILTSDNILDLCCGQGRHSIELARRGFKNVTGLDRSRYLIRLAKKRAKTEHLAISFHEGDARRFRFPENSFQCVSIMGNSFGYFEREEDDYAVLESIKRVLTSGGTLAMDLVDGDWMSRNFERRSWEWIDTGHFVCRERSLAADGFRLISREVIVDSEKGVIADQFYAERLYDRERIHKLLSDVGFINIRIHSEHSSESDRNQDLGMMAQRIFLTATSPHKVKKAKKKGPLYKDITVLLGDPSLPDTVKLNGQFNSEDFDTINQLKSALGELSDYTFDYLDNHAALVNQLRSNPPQFVLNLCDEGYNNDAFMELHVPAMLETFQIPYTGAGPAALGFCYNKSLIRSIANSLEIPVPLETYFSSDDNAATIPSVFPALVKPNFGDSSIGITQNAVVYNSEQLVEYIDKLRETLPGRPLLIEEYLTGKEYTVAVIGNPGMSYKILPLLEFDFSGLPEGLPHILGYESKWMPDSPYWDKVKCKKAQLEDHELSRIYDHVNLLFERCGCRDYARFDFRADSNGELKLLEVNPNPGWCWDGKLNIMAGLAGITYAELFLMIIEAAQERMTVGNN